MSENSQKPVRLPEQTQRTLAELVRQRDQINAALDLAVATARDCLGVPQGWVLRNLEVGFEPPAAPGAPGDGGLE